MRSSSPQGSTRRGFSQLARETLRIRAYIAQRFGSNGQVTEDEARKYYEEHPAEFTRDGVRIAFEEAEPVARQRASAERLRSTIDKWVRDLRTRSEVVIVGAGGNVNGSSVYEPPIATRSTSIELNPAWLMIGATLLRRRR